MFKVWYNKKGKLCFQITISLAKSQKKIWQKTRAIRV